MFAKGVYMITEPLELKTIIRRVENGYTRPFYCVCADGFNYYVKGNEAGCEGRCSELLSACIARAWDLPIPEFRIVHIPDTLLRYSVNSQELIADLGEGFAWGIREVEGVSLYTETIRKYISDDLAGKILLFDWFIKNEDRSLGNPNLLWNIISKELSIIDHNLAFRKEHDFWNLHVFGDLHEAIFATEARTKFEKLIKDSILHLDEYFDLIPEEWTDFEDFPAYRERVCNYLKEPFESPERFWC